MLNLDLHQRMNAGIVMIEASRKALAFVSRQIEFELIGGARRGIGPDRMAAVVEVGARLRDRQDARGAVKKLRKLGERDRVLVIEVRVEKRSRRSFANGESVFSDAAQALPRSIFLPGQRGRTAGGGGMTPA